MAVAKFLYTGAKWGSLTCTYAGYVDHKTKDNGVTTTAKVFCYVLACECGNEFRIPAREFKGKRLMRDCGDCSSGTDGVHMMVSISVPSGFNVKLRTLAKENDMTFSHAWWKFARWGMNQFIEGKRKDEERDEQQRQEAKKAVKGGAGQEEEIGVWDNPQYK